MGAPLSTWAKIRFWPANLVARLIQGTQSANVIGDIKHYAFNDQESGRNS